MIALTNGVFLDRYMMDAPITLNDIIIKEIPSCNGNMRHSCHPMRMMMGMGT